MHFLKHWNTKGPHSLQKRAHSKRLPGKSGVPITLCEQKQGSKATAAFGVLWTLLRPTILTLSRDNAETIEVGCHCFKCWNVFVIATEKKMFMQKEVFFFLVR